MTFVCSPTVESKEVALLGKPLLSSPKQLTPWGGYKREPAVEHFQGRFMRNRSGQYYS